MRRRFCPAAARKRCAVAVAVAAMDSSLKRGNLSCQLIFPLEKMVFNMKKISSGSQLAPINCVCINMIIGQLNVL